MSMDCYNTISSANEPSLSDVKVGTTPEPSSEIKRIMQISQYSTLKFTILYKQRDKPVIAWRAGWQETQRK